MIGPPAFLAGKLAIPAVKTIHFRSFRGPLMLHLPALRCAFLLCCLGTAVAAAEAAEAKKLRVGELACGKVLFLGNSITLHGPAESIGWSGNCWKRRLIFLLQEK